MAGSRLFLASLATALLGVLLASCNGTQVDMQKERAAFLLTRPVLLLTPVSNLANSGRTCEALGGHFSVEVPKRFKGNVVYSANVPVLKDLVTYANLVKNGDVNASEAASMAKTVGCQSVITIQVLEYKKYPPFKMVVMMHWIDADTGNVVGKVYNDVDASDTQVNYRYRCFSGQGPLKELYEEFQFSEDLFQTARLMPDKFWEFVSAFTTQVMFKTAEDASWQYWRVM